LSSTVVGRVDLLNSVESSDVSQFVSSGDHEVSDTFPGGWGHVDSSVHESFVALEVKSSDLYSEEGWDGDTSFQESVQGSNIGGGNCLEFSLEGSSSHTSDGALEGRVDGITNMGGRNNTEDLSIFGRNLTDGLDIVRFEIDGFLVVDGDSNGKGEIKCVVGWGKGEFTFLGDEFTFKSDSFSRSIFGKDFWNNDSEVVSGNSHVQFGEEVSNIKGVLGGETSFQEGVEGVLREESLGRLTVGVSDWHGNWGVFRWGSNVLIEEVSGERHFEEVISGELGTFTL